MPRRRMRWMGLLLVLGIAGGAAYWFARPQPVPVPTIDVSQTDPAIADAIRQALTAVEQQPRHGASWGKLGMILLAHDYRSESAHAFTMAEEFEPDEPRWPYLRSLTLILVEPEAGLACLERAVAKMPIGQPEPRLRLAEYYLAQGRTAEADNLIQRVLDRAPEQTHALVLHARLAAERQEWRAVLTRTESLREEPACRQQVAQLRSEAYQRLQQPDEARKELATALRHPADRRWQDDDVLAVERLRVGHDVRYTEATLLVQRGQIAQAINILEDLVRQYPNKVPTKAYLAELKVHHGDSGSALVLSRDVVSQDPQNVDGWLILGMAQLNTSDYAAAIVSLQHAITLKPDHGIAYLNLGLAYRKLGRPDDAKKAWQAALRCRPDLDDATRFLRELDTKP